MFKENGRAVPADKTEQAELKEKNYKCNKCGQDIPMKNPEFGERYICPNCDLGMLEEVV